AKKIIAGTARSMGLEVVR
ncbi:MAG: hypothetical protein ACRCTY_10050, partial [Candidatus Adiutrix sp.]